MLSMQDCLDYCDLSEDEIRSIAHHEHISFEAAAQMACSLAQNCAGEQVLRDMLEEVVCEAAGGGSAEDLRLAEQAFFHFAEHHHASH